MTQNGIYLDLEESTYYYVYEGFKFYFSSEFYLRNFKNKVEDYVKTETAKIVNKYRVEGYFKLYFAISLYKRIEKRGFKIYDIANKKDVSLATRFYFKL